MGLHRGYTRCWRHRHRHRCNRMEWVHSTITETGSFCTWTQNKYFCLLVKICCLYTSKFIHNYTSYTNVNVIVHIKSAINVYVVVAKYQCYSSYKININSSQITSNKIHTYISMCIVVVHSVVHLSSSVPVLIILILFLPNIYYFNNRVTDAMAYDGIWIMY